MGNQPSNGGVPVHGHSPVDDQRRQHSNNRGGSSSYSGYNGGAGFQNAGGGQKMMARSNSDASMSGGGAGEGGDTVKGENLSVENWLDDDTVPTVFRWEHGGRQVYITGTFNGWSRQIPMHRSGNDFTYIHNLKRGKHAFKFIVDDEWRFAPDQPTVADIEGRINNFIDVTDFKPYTGDREFEKEKAAAEYGFMADEEDSPIIEGKDGADRDGEVFSQTMPDMDEYTKVSFLRVFLVVKFECILLAVPLLTWRKRKCPWTRFLSLFLFHSMIHNVHLLSFSWNSFCARNRNRLRFLPICGTLF